MTTLQQTFQNDAQVTHAVQKASFEVRRAKRPDYYELLALPSIASALEIKAAYKARALEWHPDKHTASEAARQTAEARFKLLGEALEILGDEFQRKLYNEGYDKEAISERVQAANRAANQHDKDGCCNRGGSHGGRAGGPGDSGWLIRPLYSLYLVAFLLRSVSTLRILAPCGACGALWSDVDGERRFVASLGLERAGETRVWIGSVRAVVCVSCLWLGVLSGRVLVTGGTQYTPR